MTLNRLTHSLEAKPSQPRGGWWEGNLIGAAYGVYAPHHHDVERSARSVYLVSRSSLYSLRWRPLIFMQIKIGIYHCAARASLLPAGKPSFTLNIVDELCNKKTTLLTSSNEIMYRNKHIQFSFYILEPVSVSAAFAMLLSEQYYIILIQLGSR